MSIILYPIFIKSVLQKEALHASIPVFYILVLGNGSASLFFWCGGILSMAGFPEDYLIRNIILLFSNIILNFILIPILGILGAAIATSATYFISIYTLKIFVQKRLYIDLFYTR